MSGYEEEHNIPSQQRQTQQPTPRLPDLSSFFSTLEQVDTSSTVTNPQPHPAYVSAAYRQLANAYQILSGEREGVAPDPDHPLPLHAATPVGGAQDSLLGTLIADLMASADDPPPEVEGVSDEFLAELERVPRSQLKEDMKCPLCLVPFLEDKYALVVRLPCHPQHLFDLECIAPWLKVRVTCPLDRKRLVKEREPVVKKEERGRFKGVEEETDEWDEMYG